MPPTWFIILYIIASYHLLLPKNLLAWKMVVRFDLAEEGFYFVLQPLLTVFTHFGLIQRYCILSAKIVSHAVPVILGKWSWRQMDLTSSCIFASQSSK